MPNSTVQSPDPQPPTPDPLPLTPTQLTNLLTNLPPGVKVNLEKLSTGEVAVSYDTPEKTKTQLIAEKYPHLVGVGITISQAAVKYGVPRGAIDPWVYRSKDVHFTDEAAYPKQVDEAEVALCAEIYLERKKAGGLTGFPFFDDDGRLLTRPKHPHRSKKANQAA